MNLNSPNPNLWDPVAYRVKFTAHPKVGSNWCIYPTYDYTHCIVDSLEEIDYSVCTLEFETRRESYYLLLDQLGLYKPQVYEFARLNLSYTMLSKRKLKYLVEQNLVKGWNDPRLPTLSGLRRRGFSSVILNQLCKDIGVTRVQSTVEIERLHAISRQIYEHQAPRTLAVLNPVLVKFKTEAGTLPTSNHVSALNFPHSPERGTHVLHWSNSEIYIDACDFRLNMDVHNIDEYYGLAVGRSVGLKYAHVNITCVNVIMKADKIDYLEATLDFEKKEKVKTHIAWVSADPKANKTIQVRVYEHLFTKSEIPADEPWENFIHHESQQVYRDAKIDISALSYNPTQKALELLTEGNTVLQSHVWQFERLGYFVLDSVETLRESWLFNRVVALKDTKPSVKKNDMSKTMNRKAEQEKKLQEKLARAHLNPRDMFRTLADLYSDFDDHGIPTHDAKGEILSKNALKKLKKDWTKQQKVFEKSQIHSE